MSNDNLNPDNKPHQNADSDNVAPPQKEQVVQAMASSEPLSDSPPLSQSTEGLLNDGIADQTSRRAHRKPIIVAAMAVLFVFTISLLGVVGTLSLAFNKALNPENIAKFAALELEQKIVGISNSAIEKYDSSAQQASPNKNKKASNIKVLEQRAPAKDVESITVVAKIYGEIRDSMIPLVALVSILAVSIVVILGTMLKAAFAPHPNNISAIKQKDDPSSSVPIIDAFKGLIDSIKSALKQ